MDYKGAQGNCEGNEYIHYLHCDDFMMSNMAKLKWPLIKMLKNEQTNWYIYTTEIYVAILKNEVGLIYTKHFQDQG